MSCLQSLQLTQLQTAFLFEIAIFLAALSAMPPCKLTRWWEASGWKGDRDLASKRSKTEWKPGSDADQDWRQGTWGASSSSSGWRADAARQEPPTDWKDWRPEQLVAVPTFIETRPWGSGKKYLPLRARNLREQRQQQRRVLAHRLGQWIDEAGGFAKVDIEEFIRSHLDYDWFLWNRDFVVRKKSPHLTEESPILPPVFFSKYSMCLRLCFQKARVEQLDPDLVLRLARRFDKLDTNQFAAWYQYLCIRELADEDAEEEKDLQLLQLAEQAFSDSSERQGSIKTAVLKTLSRVSVPDKADQHSRSVVKEQRIEEQIQIEVETATVRATALVSRLESWTIEMLPKRLATQLAEHCLDNEEQLQFLSECRQDGAASSADSPAVAAGEDPEETFPGTTPLHRKYGVEWLLPAERMPGWYREACVQAGIPWRQKSLFDWKRRCHPCDVLPNFPDWIASSQCSSSEEIDLADAAERLRLQAQEDMDKIINPLKAWLLDAMKDDGLLRVELFGSRRYRQSLPGRKHSDTDFLLIIDRKRSPSEFLFRVLW